MQNMKAHNLLFVLWKCKPSTLLTLSGHFLWYRTFLACQEALQEFSYRHIFFFYIWAICNSDFSISKLPGDENNQEHFAVDLASSSIHLHYWVLLIGFFCKLLYLSVSALTWLTKAVRWATFKISNALNSHLLLLNLCMWRNGPHANHFVAWLWMNPSLDILMVQWHG